LEKANSFLNTIDEALATLSENRNKFGDVQNRLNRDIGMMDRTILDLKKTESIIVDVDYGAESLNFNKQKIIAQAGNYAMTQANPNQESILQLLK
jgi:flagellin